jgi:hypothetical protein
MDKNVLAKEGISCIMEKEVWQPQEEKQEIHAK